MYTRGYFERMVYSMSDKGHFNVVKTPTKELALFIGIEDEEDAIKMTGADVMELLSMLKETYAEPFCMAGIYGDVDHLTDDQLSELAGYLKEACGKVVLWLDTLDANDPDITAMRECENLHAILCGTGETWRYDEESGVWTLEEAKHGKEA